MAIRTKTSDYIKVLEGVGYTNTIIKNTTDELVNLISSINRSDVIGGTTGKEYCEQLKKAQDSCISLAENFKTNFYSKIEKVCENNGIFVGQTALGNFEETAKKFQSLAAEIKEIEVKATAKGGSK